MNNVSEIERQVQFMHRMLESYGMVHNDRYWNEIDAFIKEGAKGRLLDIGCGPGLLLKDLDERYNPRFMYGIDLSPVMLEKAEEILVNANKEGRLELVEQHMQQNWKLPENIDLIFSSRVLRSFDDQVTIMTEINHALKENGRLIILDWDKAPLSTYSDYFDKSSHFNIELSEKIRLHRNFSRYSISDWEFILTHLNFKIIHAFQLDEVHICIIAQKI